MATSVRWILINCLAEINPLCLSYILSNKIWYILLQALSPRFAAFGPMKFCAAPKMRQITLASCTQTNLKHILISWKYVTHMFPGCNTSMFVSISLRCTTIQHGSHEMKRSHKNIIRIKYSLLKTALTWVCFILDDGMIMMATLCFKTWEIMKCLGFFVTLIFSHEHWLASSGCGVPITHSTLLIPINAGRNRILVLWDVVKEAPGTTVTS